MTPGGGAGGGWGWSLAAGDERGEARVAGGVLGGQRPAPPRWWCASRPCLLRLDAIHPVDDACVIAAAREAAVGPDGHRRQRGAGQQYQQEAVGVAVAPRHRVWGAIRSDSHNTEQAARGLGMRKANDRCESGPA